MKNKILIVDDDESTRIRLNSLLSGQGYEVFAAESAYVALDILSTNDIPVIISDHRMPEMTGVEFFETVQAEYPHTVRMVLSAYEDFNALSSAFNHGAIYKYLAKKWEDDEILLNVSAAFGYYEQLGQQLVVNNSFSQIIEAVVITDQKGQIVSFNQAFVTLIDCPQEGVVGQKLDIFDCPTEILTEIQHDLHKQGCWQGKLSARKHGGQTFPAFLSISTIKDGRGIVNQVAYYFIDISANQVIEERLNYEVLHDKLTDLLNRKSFTDKITQKIDRCPEDKSVQVMVLDIERFRNINTIMGSSFGDAILKLVAERIQESLCDYEALLARIGDDQFAIGLICPLDSSVGHNLARQIIEDFKKPFQVKQKDIYLQVNIGASIYPNDGYDAIILLQNAISASHIAKKIGKKHYISYKPSLTKGQEDEKILISDIRSSIKNEEFVYYYQPKIDVSSGHVVGMEALLRWNHPKHGMLLPRDFLKICEDTYLIVDIERQMIYKGCEFLVNLNKKFGSRFTLSMNLSVQEFKCANIFYLLKDLINHTSIEPELIELEITESNLIHNLTEMNDYFQKIRELGIRISLDDFGKGYSSLKYLTVLDFDIAKIDKTFIDDIELNQRKQDVFLAMIELCEKLGLKTVVEGIEKKAQLDFLKKLPCTYAQGYLISVPLEQYKLLQFIDSQAIVKM